MPASTWIGENSLGWLVTGIAAAALYSAARALAGEPTRFPAPVPTADDVPAVGGA